MTTYYNRSEIQASMSMLVEEYLKECSNCEQLPEDFKDLLKHNFNANFVHFNPATNAIEIGVENPESVSAYPEIQVMSFPLNSDKSWVDNSFRAGKNDLAFYGRLLNRKKTIYQEAEVVVM
jgi:hypothetical protein